MMKVISWILVFAMFSQGVLFAQTISDVPRTDAAYTAIQQVVREGYLSLFSNNAFRGDMPVTRREVAIVVDKLLKEMDLQSLNLTKAEVQELVNLTKNYKFLLTEGQSSQKLFLDKMTLLENEQKAINYDLSKINQELNTEVKTLREDLQQQQLYTIIGIGAAIVIALLIR